MYCKVNQCRISFVCVIWQHQACHWYASHQSTWHEIFLWSKYNLIWSQINVMWHQYASHHATYHNHIFINLWIMSSQVTFSCVFVDMMTLYMQHLNLRNLQIDVVHSKSCLDYSKVHTHCNEWCNFFNVFSWFDYTGYPN